MTLAYARLIEMSCHCNFVVQKMRGGGGENVLEFQTVSVKLIRCLFNKCLINQSANQSINQSIKLYLTRVTRNTVDSFLTDTSIRRTPSIKRTPTVGPCLSLLPLFDSL